MAKSSILLDKLIKEGTNNPMRKELMRGAEEPIALIKAVCFLHIALGEAAGKTLLEREPNMYFETMSLKDLIQECNDDFQEKPNIDSPIDKHPETKTKCRRDPLAVLARAKRLGDELRLWEPDHTPRFRLKNGKCTNPTKESIH